MFFLFAQLSFNQLKTGDVILFGDHRFALKDKYTSTSDFFTHFVQEMLWSVLIYIYAHPFYHVGMIVDRSDIPSEIKLPKEYIHEKKFILETRFGQGIRFNPLSKRLGDRPERIVVRQLSPVLTRVQKTKFQKALVKFYDTPFENSFWKFLKDYFFPRKKPNLEHMYCCEIVAEVLKSSGILDENLYSSSLKPDHFAAKASMPFIKPFGLLHEVRLK
ncbi:MAG: hypothetical protein H6850_02695 [Alphaproteobacteria bacterium]|nr:MAG: hypothetical protein H6850_02695 [Alphaproteobacteria bacterium]